jgi:tetratricopeptide (TPR) repeat protein
LGLYHAEIIDKIGKLIGGMTYGASEKKAIAHFEKAIKLAPLSPIAHIEYGNGLYMLYGDKRLDEVSDLYERATGFTPRDAVEKLDIEAALAEFE